jgi:hypothetical protein
MFKKIKEFFVGKPAAESKFAHPLDAVTTPSAPYKVPEPAATTPIPLVVEAAPAPVVEEVAPAKKPRKPRTPKVAPVAVKEKAPAKAKAPKLTVVKSTKSKKA